MGTGFGAQTNYEEIVLKKKKKLFIYKIFVLKIYIV